MQNLLKNNEFQLSFYDDESIELDFGPGITAECGEEIIKSIVESGYEVSTEDNTEKKLLHKASKSVPGESLDPPKYTKALAQVKLGRRKESPRKDFRPLNPMSTEVSRPAKPINESPKSVSTSLGSKDVWRAKDKVEYKPNKAKTGRELYSNPDTFKAEEPVQEELVQSENGQWSLNKEDAYWSPKAQRQNMARLRTQQRNERRQDLGLKPIDGTAPVKTPKPAPIDPSTLADGSGKKYVEIKDKPPLKKSEEFVKFDDNGQWSVEKSNYGPKGGGQYTPADNVKRKQKNTESIDSLGNMGNVKRYGASNPSAKAREDRRISSLNRKQPVKNFTAEEIEQYKAQKEQEAKVKKSIDWEDGHALSDRMEKAIQLQPTDQQLFGAGVVSQEQADTAKSQWEGTINNWHTEVSKPVEAQDLSKSWGSRGPIHKERLSEEEERIRQIPVDPRLLNGE